MNVRHAIAAAALAAISVTSFAQTTPATPAPATPATPVDQGVGRGTNTPQIDKHQEGQRDRIKQGVQSGELTHKEAHRLRSKEADVRQEKRAAKADGTVSAEERAAIRKKQDKVGKDIYKQKHDDATKAPVTQPATK